VVGDSLPSIPGLVRLNVRSPSRASTRSRSRPTAVGRPRLR
jgi:hypothetical protein